jgi:hypothetical protein
MKSKYIEIAVMVISPKEHLGIVRSVKGDVVEELYRGEYRTTHWAAYHDAGKYYETTVRKGGK